MPVTQESELKQTLRTALTDQCVGIRQRRKFIEQNWLTIRQKHMNIHYDAHFRASDTDPSKYNTPFGRRTLERTIVRIVKMLTPTPKWHETEPMDGAEEDQQRLSNVDAFMTYILRKRIKSRSNISQLARTCVMYGMPILKTSIEVVNGKVWPTQRAVDPFSFYIYPETSPTIDQADIKFEDFMISYERYSALAEKGFWDVLRRDEVGPPDWPYHVVERLAHQGLTHPTDGADIEVRRRDVKNQLYETTMGYISMTELWHIREDKLYQVYIAWNLKKGPTLVGFFQSQYDQPLYRSAIHRPMPGETYTSSQAEDISELDTIQVDLFNQFMSAVNYEQGFMLLGSQEQGRRDAWKMKGRAIINTQTDNPREGVQFIEPPNTSNNLLKTWQVVVAMIQSLGGSGSIAEGQPGRNMPRAGFAMNNLINLGLADVSDVAELIEQEVLTPGLSDIYKVAQFIPPSQLMKIPGGSAFYNDPQKRSTIIYKKDIIPGDYEFEWIGSLEFQDVQQNAQRMMIFLNLLSNPNILQELDQQGMMVNLPEMIQMMWRYTLGQRGLNKIILPKPPPAPVSPQVPLSAGMPQGQGQGGQNGQQSRNGRNGSSNGTPGLSYNLPSVTSGFVQQ